MKKHLFLLASVSFLNMLAMPVIPDNYNRNRERFTAYRNQRKQLNEQRIQRSDAVKHQQREELKLQSQRRIPYRAHYY